VTVPPTSNGVLRLSGHRNIIVDGQAWAGGERALGAGTHVVTFDYVAPERLELAALDINARTP
jgi:alpha-L-rhamnosidase